MEATSMGLYRVLGFRGYTGIMEKENGSYYYGVIQGLGFRVGVLLG